MEPAAGTSHPSNPSSQIELAKPIDRETSDRIFSLVCLIHREQETQTLRELYWQGLGDLTMQQARQLADLIVKETEFWPTPARLRRLAGAQRTPTPEQIEEADALRDLGAALDTLAPASRDSRRREQFIAQLKADMTNHRITKTISSFGSGSLAAGLELLCGHPRFTRPDEGREALGLELSSIEKLERRWIAAWKEQSK